MTLRLATLVLVPVLAMVAPALARAQAPVIVPPARTDSTGVFFRADSAIVPVGDATRWIEREVVRVPAGTSPLAPPDSATATASPARKDRMPVPIERVALLAGLGFPVAPSSFTDQWNPGGMFGGAIDLDLEPRFGVRVRVEWSQLAFDERRFLQRAGLYGSGASVEGGDASFVLLSVMPRFHARTAWPRFYVEGGPGFGLARTGDAILYDPVNAELLMAEGENEFRGGATAGFGVEFARRDGSGFFIDVHWSAIFTKGRTSQMIPVAIGFLFP